MTEDEVFLFPLVEGETVCDDCWLAYWAALDSCPSCELWAPSK